METSTLIDTLDTHTAGEPTRIVTGGLPHDPRGESVAAQRDRLEAERDWVRPFLMHEPRGHDDMFGAIPVEPAVEEADLGIVWLDHEGWPDMCGHGTIGVVTAFVETGRLEPAERITIETPAGLVTARPDINDGSVASVTMENVPSFVVGRRTVDVPGVGEIAVNVVYSGIFVAIVDVGQLGLAVESAHVDDLREAGLAIRAAVNDELDLTDPHTGDPGAVRITEFSEPTAEGYRNLVVLADGSLDRSPCGTGTCAKATLLHHEGDLEVGEPFVHESVIGTAFEGRVDRVESRAGSMVAIPAVSGSAHIIAKNTYVRDPADPLTGFAVGPTG